MANESSFRLEFTNLVWARELRADPAFRVLEEIVEDANWGTYPLFRAYVQTSGVGALAAFLVRQHHDRVQEVLPDGTIKDHRLRLDPSTDYSPEASIIEQLLGSASRR